jgi:hypothetical protein
MTDPSLSFKVSCKTFLPPFPSFDNTSFRMQHHLATLANRSLAYEPYHVVDTVRLLATFSTVI